MTADRGDDTAPRTSTPQQPVARPTPDRDDPVLPTRSSEDSEQAWGDGDGRRDDEWYRRERPPHHE